MPIILQNYKSVAFTHFCHSHVENGFKMNRVLIKVKVSMNLYLHIVNFEIERYITIMHGTYAFYKVMSFFPHFFFVD